MSLTEESNKDGYQAQKENPYVLSVRYEVAGNKNLMVYDFMARVMTLRTDGYGDAGVKLYPFGQLDRDGLTAFRDELVRQGGTPPALSAEAPQLPQTPRKLTP